MVNRNPALRLLLVVSAWALAMPGSAQTASVSVGGVDDAYAPEPAHIAYLDGAAVVTREGRAEPASINVPLVSGDQLSTQEGRAEVLFGDGSVLDLDHFTTVDFLSDDLTRLTEGRIHITIGGRDRVAYRVDTPSAAVRIDSPGEYRISLVGESGRRDVELLTVRGYATLVNEFGETSVRAGERAFATAAMAPSYAQAYNSAAWDAFDRWAADRRGERTGGTSAQYLPDEIRGYAGDFDRYGAWDYDVSYGYVWYPRVRVDWRPYSYGRWSYYGPWGWTWIAYDRWGWPTHHYGRWGFRSGVWFWIPSRHWAPAYVYWAGASDYIGWCPLGWDNRPIFNIININIGRGYRGYDPYRAWTVVPRHAFRNHVDVGRYAVARSEIDHAVPRWYVAGASAPIRPALAARNASPIYSAGRASRTGPGLSGPRGGSDVARPRDYGEPAGASAPAIRSVPQASGTRSRVMPRDSADRPVDRGGVREVRRATPPAAAGSLGPTTNWTRPAYGRERPDADGTRATLPDRAVTRGRAPYRDAGPGGPEPRYEPRTDTPGPDFGRGRAEPRSADPGSRGAEVGAPRGVPSGGIYGQRGVPRDDDTRVYSPRSVPRGSVYGAPPERVEPPSMASPAPRPSRSRPDGYGGGGYSPRPSAERPSYGPPASAPAPSRGAPSAGRPGGGDRGGERAAPRGSSAPSPRSSSGGHSRPRPQ